LKARLGLIAYQKQDAENKFKEAEKTLKQAKDNFETAKLKSEQIRVQGNTLSVQTTKLILNTVEEDIKRLKSLNLSLIKLEQDKSVGEICNKLSQIALLKAAEKINEKMNYNFQKRIISQNIEKLSLKTAIES
jgi:F0F1-type ATP synthase membrane subunit b/b'